MVTLADVTRELDAWIDGHWDSELTARDWWKALADARWTAPALAVDVGGRGWSREWGSAVRARLTERGVLGPPDGIGLALAAPTIAQAGSAQQRARFIPAILAGEAAWCQLFSEPDAGSDLASLRTTAQPDGDGWVVSGTKVWTSFAQYADWGMLLARTSSGTTKHRGISWFALPMDQPGVEVRPIREMTGESFFNEVFLDGARIPGDCLVGPVDDGWRVAMTTLAEERAGIGSDMSRAMYAVPGERAGHLDQRVGTLLAAPFVDAMVAVDQGTVAALVSLARQLERHHEPPVRAALTQLWMAVECHRIAAAVSGAAGEPGAANLAKLRLADLYRRARDVGSLVLGPLGTLVDASQPGGDLVQRITLFGPALSIAGGTDQIQRNLVAERVLGLPRDA